MTESILTNYKKTKVKKVKPASVLDLNKKTKVKSISVLAQREKRQKKPWSKKKIGLTVTFATLGVTLAVLGTLVGVKTDWQMISDELKARDYTPTAEIKEIAETLRLTRKGKSIFYATHPKLLTSNAFNRTCGGDGEKGSYILGCYYAEDTEEKKEHLHVFDTGVARLDENGVHYDFVTDRNITAMHEMLHAAYERLDSDKQSEMCGYARTIIGENKSLASELEGYSDDQICTEAFARIGSEYIIAYSGYEADVAVPYKRDDLTVAGKIAADKLGAQYQKYFSYNYELFEARQQNLNERAMLRYYITTRNAELNKYYNTILAAIGNYYAAPAAWKANLINQAIASYQSGINTLKSYIGTYQKIDNTLDSEVNSILTKITKK